MTTGRLFNTNGFGETLEAYDDNAAALRVGFVVKQLFLKGTRMRFLAAVLVLSVSVSASDWGEPVGRGSHRFSVTGGGNFAPSGDCANGQCAKPAVQVVTIQPVEYKVVEPLAEVVDLERTTLMRENHLTVPPVILDVNGKEKVAPKTKSVGAAAEPPKAIFAPWEDAPKVKLPEIHEAPVLNVGKIVAGIFDTKSSAVEKVEQVKAPETIAGPTAEQLALMKEFHLSVPPTILNSSGGTRTTTNYTYTAPHSPDDCPECRLRQRNERKR